MWQRRIIHECGDRAYDYTHDLLREVAYAGLSPVRRRALHRRIARALEEIYAPELEDGSGSLAAHYEAAGMAEEAICAYRTAAAVRKQRFADVESAELLRRALNLRREFPENSKRDTEELELLVTLGPSLVTTHGYSNPEVGETYARALLLSRRSNEREHLFSVLGGAWLFNIVRANLEESRRLAQDCVDQAQREKNVPVEMAGRFLLGTSLFHMGQLAASREQIQHALRADSRPYDQALALFAGPNVDVFCRAYMAHVLWQLGYPTKLWRTESRRLSWLGTFPTLSLSRSRWITRQCSVSSVAKENSRSPAPRKPPPFAASTASCTTWLGPKYWKAGRLLSEETLRSLTSHPAGS